MSDPNERTPKVFTLYESNPPRWNDYYVFAHEFDGYEAFPETLYEVADSVRMNWYEQGVLPDDLILLRASLFREARSSRFITGYPAEEDMGYLDGLVHKIKELMEVQNPKK
jgi:hypothetical protein